MPTITRPLPSPGVDHPATPERLPRTPHPRPVQPSQTVPIRGRLDSQ